MLQSTLGEQLAHQGMSALTSWVLLDFPVPREQALGQPTLLGDSPMRLSDATPPHRAFMLLLRASRSLKEVAPLF